MVNQLNLSAHQVRLRHPAQLQRPRVILRGFQSPVEDQRRQVRHLRRSLGFARGELTERERDRWETGMGAAVIPGWAHNGGLASHATYARPGVAAPPWAVKTSSPIRRSCPEFTSEAVFAPAAATTTDRPTERVGRERRVANLCGLVFTNAMAELLFPDF